MCREGVIACKLPQLNISSPEIMKFIHDVPPLFCGIEDWVAVEGSKLVITKKAKTKHGKITCIFSGKLAKNSLCIYKNKTTVLSQR